MVKSQDHHHLPPSSDSQKTPKTHCRWNHEYASKNTCIRRDGKRVCTEVAACGRYDRSSASRMRPESQSAH